MASTGNEVDRGWAWVVLLASFGTLTFTGSVALTTGVIHVFLLETFQEDSVKTSWVGALSGCLLSFVGPIAGFLASRTTCRVAMVAGGLMCLAGFTTSSLVTSLDSLFITYGFLVALLAETVGEYSSTFYLSGSVVILSSVLGMLVHVFKSPTKHLMTVTENIDLEIADPPSVDPIHTPEV